MAVKELITDIFHDKVKRCRQVMKHWSNTSMCCAAEISTEASMLTS